jgi:hypothetical protein
VSSHSTVSAAAAGGLQHQLCHFCALQLPLLPLEQALIFLCWYYLYQQMGLKCQSPVADGVVVLLLPACLHGRRTITALRP